MKTVDDISDEDWKDFQDFMEGKTFSIHDDGIPYFYQCDVDRFNHIKGKSEFEWEFIRSANRSTKAAFLESCKETVRNRVVTL